MHVSRLLIAGLVGFSRALRQPERTSEAPGLTRDTDGRYTEPIGPGRDPLRVFSVVSDVDGRLAIRISGEVFGELRTRSSFKDYHRPFQFKWGEKKWAPREKPETARDSQTRPITAIPAEFAAR